MSLSNIDTLEEYLKFGINPNTEDKNSQTLLHEAVKVNYYDVTRLLKKYNADLNYKDKMGKTPIFYAKFNDVWCIRFSGTTITLS